jgi:anti-anti-sigma factor
MRRRRRATSHDVPGPLPRDVDRLLTITIDVPQACVMLSGELDAVTASVLGEAISILMSATPKQITIDLGGLHFIDAAGLGHLVQLRQTLARAGQALTLRRPSNRIAQTFAIGGLQELLEPDRAH